MFVSFCFSALKTSKEHYSLPVRNRKALQKLPNLKTPEPNSTRRGNGIKQFPIGQRQRRLIH